MIHIQPGPLSTITLQRESKAYAYTREMLSTLNQGITEPTGIAKTVVIQSEGSGAFHAGADLSQRDQAQPEDAHNLLSQHVFT